MGKNTIFHIQMPRSGSSLLPLSCAGVLKLVHSDGETSSEISHIELFDLLNQVKKGSIERFQKCVLVIRDPRSLLVSRHPEFPQQCFFGFDHSLCIETNWISYTNPGIFDYFSAIALLQEFFGSNLLIIYFEELFTDLQRNIARYQSFTGLSHTIVNCHFEKNKLDHTRVAPWKQIKNIPRIKKLFTIEPKLFDLLEAWGYEKDQTWFTELNQAISDASRVEQGTIIGYFTKHNHYAAEAERLERSTKRLKLPIDLTPIARSRDWLSMVRFKSKFLKNLRHKMRGPLIYIDVDAVVHSDPWPYLSTLDCDVAFCAFRDGMARSGTIYLADTPGATAFLQDWGERLEANPEAWDQHPFDDISREQRISSDHNYSVQFLPPALCYVFDRKKQAAVDSLIPCVEHLQASREITRGPNLENRRIRLRQIEQFDRLEKIKTEVQELTAWLLNSKNTTKQSVNLKNLELDEINQRLIKLETKLTSTKPKKKSYKTKKVVSS
jgi:hypothetical protein